MCFLKLNVWLVVVVIVIIGIFICLLLFVDLVLV